VIAEKPDYCPNSVDNYVMTFNAVQNYLQTKLSDIASATKLNRSPEIELAIGWQSDFNGWVDHSRPKYGKKGCGQQLTDREPTKTDLVGLAHPGMLSDYWKTLELEGMQIESLKFASEKFLQMWEKMQTRAKN
jgi:hypothetical protein